MNADLEFLRALRDDLMRQRAKLNLEGFHHPNARCSLFAEADQCEKIASRISVYLKSRGIE